MRIVVVDIEHGDMLDFRDIGPGANLEVRVWIDGNEGMIFVTQDQASQIVNILQDRFPALKRKSMKDPNREEQLMKLAHLALWCMNEAHGDNIGDVDGGALQDKATELGILVTREVNEPCCESCACAEYGFPTTCYRAAAWVESFEVQFGMR